MRAVRVACRYLVAFLMVAYGFEGDTVFAGDYQLRGETLLLRGVLDPPGDSVRMRLLRVEAPPGTGIW